MTPKSDVYSFAMILWELLTSSTPFQDVIFLALLPSAAPDQLTETLLPRSCSIRG